MEWGEDLEMLEGLPVLYIKGMKALVVADLHLGYEGGMAKEGAAIPKANLKSVMETLGKALEGRTVERLIVVGDIKNDFSNFNAEELNELGEIARALKKKGVSIDLVKGNHDNFIDRYSQALGIAVHSGEFVLNGYLFAHGDRQLKKAESGVSTIIIGHEHPSIGIRSRVGTIERLRCFLSGKIAYGGRKTDLIVLPAVGYFETGSDINLHGKGRIMSPVLKKADLDRMEAIAVGHGSTLGFGRIGDLRTLEL
jgi:putative SbcD/Mre11-related phosphoesterase